MQETIEIKKTVQFNLANKHKIAQNTRSGHHNEVMILREMTESGFNCISYHTHQ